MAGTPAGDDTSRAQWALRKLSSDEVDDEAVNALAESNVLVPLPGEGDAEEATHTLTLPVIGQEDGAQLVPVFTSAVRLAQEYPDIHRYRLVPLGTLAAYWPSDDVSLTIDAGTEESLTLSAERVRTLLARTG